MMLVQQIITIYEISEVNTITLETYVEVVLRWEAPQMVGHLVSPEFIDLSDRITGVCCPEDETPYRYVIDTQTAKLVNLYEVKA